MNLRHSVPEIKKWQKSDPGVYGKLTLGYVLSTFNKPETFSHTVIRG